ncbi:MAG: serine/threonine protein kinase [Kiritimatiellae bacterium]|nr:serine/threonine protein kinase [Kiritimatiellia bacterium]
MPDARDDEIEGFLRVHGPFEKPPHLSCGERIGDWKAHAFLGRGGSAEVYRAENVVTGIVGALKVLCRTDGRSRERFRRETHLLAETKSPAFPMFYGAGESDGHLYIAEELLEPITLPSDDVAVAKFILDVAAGIEELHRRGFVHRDLKPANVLMRPSTGEYVLIDMGLAKESEDASPMRNDTLSVVDGRAVGVGTPGFSAPEQFTGGKVGGAMDIHALGVLANACFDGKPPKAWIDVIRRSTSSIPEQRYASVDEFVHAVRRRHAARRWIVAIVAMSLAAAALFCLYPQKDQNQAPLKESPARVVLSGSRVGSRTNLVVHETHVSSPTSPVVHETHVSSSTTVSVPTIPATNKLAEAILEAAYDNCSGGRERRSEVPATNEAVRANELLALGKTKYERGLLVTRIALNGKDVSLPGEIKLTGKRRIEISGYGRLTASISGSRGVRLQLSEQATLINLTTIPYPQAGMRYILKGPCYLNFKNLDSPDDIKNIWVDTYDGKGDPSFRFRGPDSYEQVRKEDKEAAMDALRKGILPSY